MAIKFATIDSTVSLLFAFFINAAILIVSAATFHYSGYKDVADIHDAYKLLSPILGTSLASILFAVALLASRTKLYTHRNFSRTNRDGRIPKS